MKSIATLIHDFEDWRVLLQALNISHIFTSITSPLLSLTTHLFLVKLASLCVLTLVLQLLIESFCNSYMFPLSTKDETVSCPTFGSVANLIGCLGAFVPLSWVQSVLRVFYSANPPILLHNLCGLTKSNLYVSEKC